MRFTLFALLLGAAFGLAACNGDDETDDTSSTDDTSYDGMRVRATDVGWRIPARD